MQFIGCDVSKLSLDLAWFDSAAERWIDRANVPNQRTGWQALMRWIERHVGTERAEIAVVMEATAVYHLRAANYLSAQGFKVLVCNPGRAAEYTRSQNRLNKSDRLDARQLQRYAAGLQQRHWFTPDAPAVHCLKSQLALLDQCEKDLLRWHNRLEKASHQDAATTVLAAIRRQCRNLTRECARVQQSIDALIQRDPGLRRNQQLMSSITGIGAKTSQRLLPLVNPERFESARQLAAYLGLTPCHRSSGTSLHAAGRLSGRGNPFLRAKLYMPAVTAKRHNPELRAFYQRLRAKGKTEKQAITAVMRKLVHTCYGVVKHQTPYEPNGAALT